MSVMRAPDDAALEGLAARLGEAIRPKGWRVATAESSTGGLIGHAITMIPGSSAYYVGGVICYSNLAKERELRVTQPSSRTAARSARRWPPPWRRVPGTGSGWRWASPSPGSPVRRAPPPASRSASTSSPWPRWVIRPSWSATEFGFARDGNRAAAAAAALDLAIREAAAWAMVRAGERIHVIGIAGSGAAGVAVLAQRAGALVDGCDADAPSPYTPPLDAAGIAWRRRPRSSASRTRRSGGDQVLPSVPVPGNAELAAAEAAGLPVVTWQELLGELMGVRRGASALRSPGRTASRPPRRCSGICSSPRASTPPWRSGPSWPGGAARTGPGDGAPFVVEADELGDNFLHYHPAGAVVTNIEMDHPDYFANRAAVMDSFERFVRGMRGNERLGGRLLLVTEEDPGDAGAAPAPG